MADQAPAELAPVVYLLYGEDELAISEYIGKLTEKLGDKTMAEMNITRLDGRTCSLDVLVGAVSTLPFLVKRRMVILTHPLEYSKPDKQKRFKDILNKVASTTALVLVEGHALTSERERKSHKINWLEKWAQEAEGRAIHRNFSIPMGPKLAEWIRNRVKSAGGQITPQAAEMLASRVGLDPRLLDLEIGKLLAYANYARTIEVDDVVYLTPDSAGAPDFALVNALRAHDTRQALNLLQRELAVDDPLRIFQGIVFQFRQLLLAREILDEGGREEDVIRQLGVHPFVAQKAVEHARRFTLGDLEGIYRRLLALDEALKTSAIEGELALDVLVTELSA
jgi:DNA polymerase-3 subunit delta